MRRIRLEDLCTTRGASNIEISNILKAKTLDDVLENPELLRALFIKLCISTGIVDANLVIIGELPND